jgi:triacylglycerol lipase
LIGHSTGGLDARVLLSPGSDLDAGHAMRQKLGDEAFVRYADALKKVRTTVAVATPNFGTPLANLGARLSFDALLNAMSDAAKTPLIRGGLTIALRVAAPIVDLVQQLPIDTPLLDWIDAEVLSEDPQAVLRYLDGIGVDTGALRNLTQEGTDLANALLLERPGVQYASVVTGTARATGRIDANDPLIYANTLFFRAAWEVAAQRDENYAYAERNAELQGRHESDRVAGLDVGEISIDDQISDGIVPTASQPHGEPLVVVASDHLDCVGHFPHTLPDGTEVSGWVRSGAGFNQDRFEIVWSRVAELVSRSLGN